MDEQEEFEHYEERIKWNELAKEDIYYLDKLCADRGTDRPTAKGWKVQNYQI